MLLILLALVSGEHFRDSNWHVTICIVNVFRNGLRPNVTYILVFSIWCACVCACTVRGAADRAACHGARVSVQPGPAVAVQGRAPATQPPPQETGELCVCIRACVCVCVCSQGNLKPNVLAVLKCSHLPLHCHCQHFL